MAGWPKPVIVDLGGMKVQAKSIPVLIDHSIPLGHSSTVEVNASSVRVTGVQSHPGQAANDVILAGKNAFPWQVSIGAGITKASFIDAGETVEVNGRKFTGPVYVARQSTLKEVSFVALGADGQTSATVEARHYSEGNEMFEQWLKARGIDSATLTDEARSLLQQDFDTIQAAASSEGEPEPEAPANIEASDEDQLKASRAIRSAEVLRVAKVEQLAKGFPDIAAKAIDEGWSDEKTELAVIKARAPKVSASRGDAEDTDSLQVLEAAFAKTIAMRDREQAYDERTLEAADKQFRGGISICELVAHFASQNGHGNIRMRGDQEIERAIRAAFSTSDISSILSNVGNKTVQSAFNAVEQEWRKICRVGSTTNFKTNTRVSLTGDAKFLKVNPSGKITSGDLGNQVYTNKVDTYGRILSLTREEMINDDAGALNDVFMKLGRGGALALNTDFWATFLADLTFSATAVTAKGSAFNSNLSASTALTVAGVSTAEGLFDAQVDPDGNPLGATAAFLLTAAKNKATAWQICNSTQLISGNTTAAPANNPHAGKFEHVSSRYLTTDGTWYLLADPMDIAVMEVLFLNGQESPVIEQFMPAVDQLGIVYRGVYDFGCAAVEKRGAVKVTA